MVSIWSWLGRIFVKKQNIEGNNTWKKQCEKDIDDGDENIKIQHMCYYFHWRSKNLRLTHFSPVLRFMQKPVISFALQKK